MAYEQIIYTTTDALAIGKQGFYAQVDRSDETAMNFAKHTITMNLMAEDAQAGIKAFLERTAPEWKNRY